MTQSTREREAVGDAGEFRAALGTPRAHVGAHARAQPGEGLQDTSQCRDLHAKLGTDTSVAVGISAAKGLLWTSVASKSYLQHQLRSDAGRSDHTTSALFLLRTLCVHTHLCR